MKWQGIQLLSMETFLPGTTVDEAENGQLGLDACEASMPDVILLDWNMPVMTGIEFTQILIIDRCCIFQLA